MDDVFTKGDIPVPVLKNPMMKAAVCLEPLVELYLVRQHLHGKWKSTKGRLFNCQYTVREALVVWDEGALSDEDDDDVYSGAMSNGICNSKIYWSVKIWK